MSERHYHKHRARSISPVCVNLTRGADRCNSDGKSHHGTIHDSILETSESLSHVTRKRRRTSSVSSDEGSKSKSRSESSRLTSEPHSKRARDGKKRRKKKHSNKRGRRQSSSSDDSSGGSSNTSESQSNGDEIIKKTKHAHKEHKHSEHKKTKRLSKDSAYKSKKYKKDKHKHKREVKTKRSKKIPSDPAHTVSTVTTVAVCGAGTVQTVNAKSAVPVGAGSSRSRGPMTKEEYEKQQSIVRRVFDPDTGRHRLVKGDGEIVEEIVSKERHKAINKQATQGDGLSFQSGLRKLF